MGFLSGAKKVVKKTASGIKAAATSKAGKVALTTASVAALFVPGGQAIGAAGLATRAPGIASGISKGLGAVKRVFTGGAGKTAQVAAIGGTALAGAAVAGPMLKRGAANLGEAAGGLLQGTARGLGMPLLLLAALMVAVFLMRK